VKGKSDDNIVSWGISELA